MSATSSPVEHEFHLNTETTSYRLIVYDNPGLGDTAGLQKDDENIRSILSFLKDKNGDLNGVFLVLNGADRANLALPAIYRGEAKRISTTQPR